MSNPFHQNNLFLRTTLTDGYSMAVLVKKSERENYAMMNHKTSSLEWNKYSNSIVSLYKIVQV